MSAQHDNRSNPEHTSMLFTRRVKSLSDEHRSFVGLLRLYQPAVFIDPVRSNDPSSLRRLVE